MCQGRLCPVLSHSLGTAAHYYQAPTQQDSLNAYHTIQRLMAVGTPPLSTLPDTEVQPPTTPAGTSRRSSVTQTKVTSESPPPSTPPKKTKRKFSAEENEKITAFFEKHIANSIKPTLDECREFLQLFPMERTAKNLQDRIRNTIGNVSLPFIYKVRSHVPINSINMCCYI